jgi:hypothetical protein
MRAVLAPALAALAAVATAQITLMPQVIRKAGNIPTEFEGMDKFLKACDQLEILSKVALIGVVPLCVFVGLGMMAFGAKNAVQKAALPVAALMALLMVPGVIA